MREKNEKHSKRKLWSLEHLPSVIWNLFRVANTPSDTMHCTMVSEGGKKNSRMYYISRTNHENVLIFFIKSISKTLTLTETTASKTSLQLNHYFYSRRRNEQI